MAILDETNKCEECEMVKSLRCQLDFADERVETLIADLDHADTEIVKLHQIISDLKVHTNRGRN